MGYCCCRVFGFYVSGEAVLVLLLYLSAFSTSNYDYFIFVSHLLASMSG